MRGELREVVGRFWCAVKHGAATLPPPVPLFAPPHPRLLCIRPSWRTPPRPHKVQGLPSVLAAQFTPWSLLCRDGDQRVSARARHRAPVSKMLA